jgi:hypothetical protein
MATFPPDRYDEVPADLKRVGAHRAPRKRGRGAIAFAWAALATGLLIVAGLYGLSRVNPSISFELPNFGGGAEPVASASPSAAVVEPVTDPKSVPKDLPLSISILNGTPSANLHNIAGDAIKGAGWPNPSRNPASNNKITTTTIYYQSADYEGIARGLLQLLGVEGKVALTDKYANPVTIVLGADYASVAGQTEG